MVGRRSNDVLVYSCGPASGVYLCGKEWGVVCSNRNFGFRLRVAASFRRLGQLDGTCIAGNKGSYEAVKYYLGLSRKGYILNQDSHLLTFLYLLENLLQSQR